MSEEWYGLEGVEFMGLNIRKRVKFLGEGVRVYPLCKMINAQNAELHDYCRLFDYTYIDAGKTLKIGKYATVTWHCLIEGNGVAILGNRVFLGPGTKILTSTYKLNGYYGTELLPEGCQAIEYGDILIEDDAYLGAGCTVFPGSVIREGAVVGANSFVKGELEPWIIYAGSPCRPVGVREKPTPERARKIESINWENMSAGGGSVNLLFLCVSPYPTVFYEP